MMKGFDDYRVRLGDVMRAERATLGKSLLDVQEALKIKATYVSAIENSDPSAFDELAFLPGHIRSYARYLGLDPEWVLAKFCEESNYSPDKRTVPALACGTVSNADRAKRNAQEGEGLKLVRSPLAPISEGFLSRIDPPALVSSVALGALILAIGYGSWAILQELQRVQIIQPDRAAEMLVPVGPLAVASSPAPSETEGTETAGPPPEDFDRLYSRPQVLESPVVSPRDPAIITLDPERVATVFEVEDEVTVPQDNSFIESVKEALAATPVQVIDEEAEDPVQEVILLAVRPSWVRIRAADGSVLLEKILDGGERYTVPMTDQPPILKTGNAGSVYFLVDGETYGPVGEGARVVDDIVMASKQVVAGFAVADLASDGKLADFVMIAEERTGAESAQ